MQKEETEEHVESEKSALTDKEIKEWCKKNNLDCAIQDLKTSYPTIVKNAFIYTGNDKNECNNGITHHWIFLLERKHMFDSFGFHQKGENYVLPSGVTGLENDPEQYQQFYPSKVCGEYCCMFYYYYENNFDKSYPIEEISVHFADFYGLSKNRKSNDETILEKFEELKKDQKQHDEDSN